MIRIYADFNDRDAEGRVRLNTLGSLADIAPIEGQLTTGMRVVLYMTSEFEVEAVLAHANIWLGIPDWSTIRHYH